MNKRINKKDKGITLIALIITIIILLILAGVSIGIVVNGDLFDKAQDTVGKANSQSENANNQKEEIKNVWDSLPGKIIKSGTKNNYTEEKINTAPTVTASVTDTGTTTATIKAAGSDADGDTLTYTLEIDGQEYTSSTGTFSVTGLAEETTYDYTVTVSDGKLTGTATGSLTTLKSNTAPTVTVKETGITGTTVTITAKGTDADGDTLTYTLEINGKEYRSSTGTFSVTGLTENVGYPYTVTVSDGTDTGTTTGSVTWCDGEENTHTATSCPDGYGSTPCDTCTGTGEHSASESNLSIAGSGTASTSCTWCGRSTTSWTRYECGVCGNWWIRIGDSCWYHHSGDVPHQCYDCSGAGSVSSVATCPTHSLSGDHYYCDTHGYVGTSSTCTYCSHGNTEPHIVN